MIQQHQFWVFKGNKIIILRSYLYPHVLGSIIHNSHSMETT